MKQFIQKPSVLCVIPARGGSKGVPRKNIKLLNGKPLIAYTIEAVLGSGAVDKLVVSTDDAEIVNVAERYGAEVVRRPKNLARDMSPVEPSMVHALAMLEKKGYVPDFISLVQCTSPFLSSQIVKKAVSTVMGGKFTTCITVGPLHHGHEFKWDLSRTGRALPAYDLAHRLRRQDSQTVYIENGAFYITRTGLFKKTANRIGGRNAIVSAIKMDAEDSLQIDSELDFLLIEKLMQRRATQ
ncbi:MAG: acylneuraminate cytidylyltransferase family protein [Parcubacteria group bacterium]|nr:acylneuraminate cytidylyltransferase family protein [Parcubacteria group bacterium]